MKLITLGSSSKGNGYILQRNDGAVLILEAGINLSKVKEVLGFDLSKVSACLVSHSHKDHSKYMMDYARAGIQIIGPSDLLEIDDSPAHHNAQPLSSKKITMLKNGWKVIGLPVDHDVPCFAYLIKYEEYEICFITDTYKFRYEVPRATHWLIEANYDINIVRDKIASGTANTFVLNRVYESHMEIETTIEVLRRNQSRSLRKIVLLHLSDSNSNEDDFRQRVQQEIGYPVEVADKGRAFEL